LLGNWEVRERVGPPFIHAFIWCHAIHLRPWAGHRPGAWNCGSCCCYRVRLGRSSWRHGRNQIHAARCHCGSGPQVAVLGKWLANILIKYVLWNPCL
jgi:hypothetical protein